MGIHNKTLNIINSAKVILAEYWPMTIRQVYYQLVSQQIIPNSLKSYKSIGNALVIARQEGLINWQCIEDRLRRPRTVSMWDDLQDFAETARDQYRRDVWASQEYHIECWLEKDALSGIFEQILEPYGVTLNVGRGYDGWTSIYKAAERYGNGKNTIILYFGDFDPSGEDMVRSLAERLEFFRARPKIIKLALTYDDIEAYNLPSDFAKKSDTRHKGFIKKYGDVSVELDALPINILKERIIEGVESYINKDALNQVMELEKTEKEYIYTALQGI